MQLKRDGNGRPKLIDLNPRLGGGTIITALAGVNFPDLTVRLCNQEKIRIPKPREITVTRYWEEIVV
jgi:carbamoyl-phosphate synthase large subunit